MTRRASSPTTDPTTTTRTDPTMTRKLLPALALTLAALAPTAAHAEQIEPADRPVTTVRVTYVEPSGPRALYVELNNGATYRLNPCRVEDGRQCYWDADDRGNGAGRSFVVVSGRVIYSRLIGAARESGIGGVTLIRGAR